MTDKSGVKNKRKQIVKIEAGEGYREKCTANQDCLSDDSALGAPSSQSNNQRLARKGQELAAVAYLVNVAVVV